MTLRTEFLPALLLASGVLGGVSGFVGCSDGIELPPPQVVGVPPSLASKAELIDVVLSPDQSAQLRVELFEARMVEEPVRLSIPGDVQPSPEAFAVVSAPIGGRVVEILAHEGANVRRGQVVAYVESLEFAALVADVVEARAQADHDRTVVLRYEQLVAEGISPRARLEEAEAALKRSDARDRGARSRLASLGVSDEEAFTLSNTDRPRFAVIAPLAGVIDRHLIDLGQAVAAHDEMLSVVNGSEVLVRGLASPDQASRINSGDSVVVTSATGGDGLIRARVTSLAPALDPEVRAVAIHILATSGGFRPGQAVVIAIETHSVKPTMPVPLSALTYVGNQAVLFVHTGPDTYEQRPVVAGTPRESFVPIVAGLKPGEMVAVSNVYDLKALVRFEQYGE